MATVEELLQELEQEREAKKELEETLRQAAEYGCQLSLQIEEQEQTILEYKEKVQNLEETPSVKNQAQSFRRMSQSRRASTVSFASEISESSRKVAFLPGAADSDEEDKKRPDAAGHRKGRRGNGGKTIMVQDLMDHNQSLEEDVRKLRQKLEEQDESDEEEGQLRPKRRSRKEARHIEIEDRTEEESEEEDYEAQVRELRQQLQAARKDFLAKQRALEAELEAKKQEIVEHRQAEQDARASSSHSVTKLKALQRQCDLLVEQNQKAENELNLAKTKELELAYQLEEQALRTQARHSRRNWMPTECEAALRTAAARASLADEFQNMERYRKEDEHDDQSDGGGGDPEVHEAAKIEALQLELESTKAAATKEKHQLQEQFLASKAQAAKEIQELQEKLAAIQAEAAAAWHQQQVSQEQMQAVLVENSKLRQQNQALHEANEVRTDADTGGSEEAEESFWSKVLASIACARTTPKPSTNARHGNANKQESVHLAIPRSAEQAD